MRAESAFPRSAAGPCAPRDGWTQNLWLFVSLLSPIICSGLQEIKTENVSLDETDVLKKLALLDQSACLEYEFSEISSAAGYYIFICARIYAFKI